jgi:hypothetical protein
MHKPLHMGALANDNVEFVNNDIHHNTCYGIYSGGDNNLYDGNRIHDNGAYGLHGYGSPSNVTFRNNFVYNNGSRADRPSTAVLIREGPNNRLYNNVIYNQGMGGGGIELTGSNGLIYNNTVYNVGSCVDAHPGSSLTVKNNICYQTDGIIGLANASNNVDTDPGFVNASTGDFHLIANSPAKDAGVSLPEVPYDIDGNARPAGGAYDIGAYEYGATGGAAKCQPGGPPLNAPLLVDCGRQIIGSQEPSMIWGVTLASSPASGNQQALKVFYTNKNALALGSGAVSAMKQSPADSVSNPAIGDTVAKDADQLPIHPALFITDITNIPVAVSGDAQAGGLSNKPSYVYGAWKAYGAADPAANGTNRTPLADEWPAANGPPGRRDETFTAEIVWSLSSLQAFNPTTRQQSPLTAGRKYRVQVVLHYGGSPSDVGVACFQVTL